MSDFSNIIEEINTNLPDNTTQAITAKKLRDTLIDLTDTIEDQQDNFETEVSENFSELQTQVETALDNLIVDNLESTSTTSALSANQGRVLDEKIDVINQKLIDVSLNETLYDVDVDTDVKNGYLNPDGSIAEIPNVQYITIYCENYNSVRFLGVARTSGVTFYGFYDENDSLIGTTYAMDSGQQTASFKEYISEVPNGAKWLKTIYNSSAISGLPNKFYCYLIDGYPAASTFASGEFVGDVSIRKDLSLSNPDDIPSISAVVNGILEPINKDRAFNSIDFSSYIQTGCIDPKYPNILITAAGYSRCALIPVSALDGSLIKITANENYYTQITFIKSLTDTTWAGYTAKYVEYAEGTTLQTVEANSTKYYDVPSDTNYVYILIKEKNPNGPNRTPVFFGSTFDWYGEIENHFDEVDLKLKDISITETNYNVNVTTDVHNGYVQYNGTITGTGSTAIQYVQINVSGYTFVRFLGFSRTTGNTYCAFYDENDELIGTTFRFDNVEENPGLKEYILSVPENAVYFKTQYKSSYSPAALLPDKFYCYLIDGYPAASKFNTGEFVGNVKIRTDLSLTYPKDVPSVEAVVRGVTPKMFNPKADLLKPNLKILDIGNSYTQDTSHYISSILSAFDITSDFGFSLYKYIRSSGSFKTDVDCYNGVDTLGYWIAKTAGDTLSTVELAGGQEAEQDYGVKFRKLLKDTDWDIIIIHQVSNYATDFSVWQGTGSGGYLNQLIQLLRDTNPQAAIGSMIVHAYAPNYNTGGGVLAGPTQDRWRKIADSIMCFAEQYGIDLIIPYGTAVENMRLSSISEGKNNFCENDNKHLANGIGDYVANCVYYQTLLAPRIGKSIYGNTYRINISTPKVGEVSVDDTTAPIAQKAAMWATYNWYTVTNADNIVLY